MGEHLFENIETKTETLHDIAVRLANGRCGNGCVDCPANGVRTKGVGACLVRRLAKIANCEEQIEFVKQWAKHNPKQNKKEIFASLWVKGNNETINIPYWKCPKCNSAVMQETTFCPHCGRKNIVEISQIGVFKL